MSLIIYHLERTNVSFRAEFNTPRGVDATCMCAVIFVSNKLFMVRYEAVKFAAVLVCSCLLAGPPASALLAGRQQPRYKSSHAVLRQ